ncbi:hypothetical protein EMPS_04221 [Entomortierella parvispora]|uniref:Uncharacterized protein n=1 Tax=Entomortierella parvispora TaxID=205924 RepID=A0A9P3H833_9FUNG|nr:hypothetical protein EMPS_04221 [Entomortierella parvispora]
MRKTDPARYSQGKRIGEEFKWCLNYSEANMKAEHTQHPIIGQKPSIEPAPLFILDDGNEEQGDEGVEGENEEEEEEEEDEPLIRRRPQNSGSQTTAMDRDMANVG